jgi:group I intron endonuclease
MKNTDITKKGIYAIINKINYKRYIGSTSVSFEKRWWLHKWQLNNSKHKNQHLQHAWNKYFNHNFEFVIIEITDDNILEKEQYWIDLYKLENLYNINPFATGGIQFTQETFDKRRLTSIKTYAVLTDKYKKWKDKLLSNEEITIKELHQFENWSNHIPWNKGKKYVSTDHLKVPKLNKGDRTKDILTKRNNLPEIDIYDINMNFIRSFRSSRDIQDYSLTSENDLPYKSRFNTERMNKPVNLLQSVNINKSCKTGKPYKNLIFKYKQSPL